jgi:hypothetical protein
MPIIINEFEILPEPSSERGMASPASKPEAEEETTVPDALAILRVERVFWQRRRRLWAD